MAKCPMCNSKKGKRVCKLVENQKVCSLCCGTTRNSECGDIEEETLIKILGVLYFIANRRTKGGREYFNVIQHYVGGGNGVQMISNYELENF